MLRVHQAASSSPGIQQQQQQRQRQQPPRRWPLEYLRFRSQVALGCRIWKLVSPRDGYATAGDSLLATFKLEFMTKFTSFGGPELDALVDGVRRSLFGDPTDEDEDKDAAAAADFFAACVALDDEAPVCGAHRVVLSGGVPLPGLLPGRHRLATCKHITPRAVLPTFLPSYLRSSMICIPLTPAFNAG